MAPEENGPGKGAELLFFCQAEDGIRDVAVTGVQTCALPISNRAHRALRRGATLRGYVRGTKPSGARISTVVSRGAGGDWRCQANGSMTTLSATQKNRSEERRVGKEWGVRWEGQDAERTSGTQ